MARFAYMLSCTKTVWQTTIIPVHAHCLTDPKSTFSDAHIWGAKGRCPKNFASGRGWPTLANSYHAGYRSSPKILAIKIPYWPKIDRIWLCYFATSSKLSRSLRNRSFQTVHVCKTEFWVIQQNRKHLLDSTSALETRPTTTPAQGSCLKNTTSGLVPRPVASYR